MIQVIRGGAGLVRSEVLGRQGVKVEGAPPTVAWGGLRLLLARLRDEQGDDAMHAAVLPEADAVSVVLRRLPPVDPARRARLLASEDGMLTHNAVLRSELVMGLARALSRLSSGLTLLVPDTSVVDLDTLELLIAVASREGGPAGLVLGVPALAPLDHPLWRREADILAGLIASLQLREEVHTLELEPGEPGTGVAPRHSAAWDPFDDEVEQRAGHILSQDGPFEEDELQLVLSAGRLAFSSWDFHAALRLSLWLLDHAPRLEPAERARLYRRAALSAYNRQVGTDGNQALAEWLDEHLLEAWRTEPDVAARSHLAYRLCINQGRRKGELARGERWGQEAVTLANTPGLPVGLAAWLRAWAHNGLAYVLARQGRLGEAIAAMKLAEAEARLAGGDGVPEPELGWTQTVLADNLAELHLRARDLDGAARWQDRLGELEARAGLPTVFSPRRRLQLLRARHRLREAELAATHGIEAARAVMNPTLEDLYRQERADLRYRLGDMAGAWSDFEAALALRMRSGDPLDLAEARVNAALAASRAGAVERARELLASALELEEEPAAAAELWAGLALVAARAGDGELADQEMNNAIELAVATGERDVLMRVAIAAGEALLALGRRDEAGRAFAQARAIGASRKPAPNAADQFAALIGSLVLDGDPALRDAALALLPAALEDAHTWTRLGPLLEGDEADDAPEILVLRREVSAVFAES